MAEENKGNLIDQAKEMLGGDLGKAGGLVDQAKEFIQERAGGMLGGLDEAKKKAVEIGQKIAPDSLDDKVEEIVDGAVDFIKGALGKKEEK